MMRPTISESSNIQKLQIFRKGYIHFLQQFLNLSTGLLNFLASGSVAESTKRELIPIRKELDGNILRSNQSAKDLILELDEKHLIPIAKKDMASFFNDGGMDQVRMEFVMFFKTFEGLREFYNLAKDSWTQIQYSVLSANISDDTFKSEMMLRYRILPVLEMLDSLKIFLERMAVILDIKDPHLLFKTKRLEPRFSDQREYKLSSLFREGLQKTLEDDLIPQFELEDVPVGNSKEKVPEFTAKFKSTASKKPGHILNAAGKLPWNSNQHYHFRYDPEKYEEERNYFQTVINLDTHLGADEKILRAEMIRSMTSRQMKLKTADELEGEYMIFLDHFFEFCRNILLMGMGIPDLLKYLFFYHIGPQHFYMIVRKFLQEANTGYLHIRSGDGKKVTRLLPAEIIKKHVMSFWLREILPNLGDEKNNLNALKKIIEIVDNKYKEVSAHAIREFDKLPIEVKNSKPRVQIFREKMNTWMGAANIIVFKRFLKTAI